MTATEIETGGATNKTPLLSSPQHVKEPIAITESDGSNNDGDSKRRMSYFGAFMSQGIWPENDNVCDPIIELLISFDAGNCPKQEELYPFIKELLEYDRFAGVPTGTFGRNNWSYQSINKATFDLTEMIHTVECQDRNAMKNEVENAMHCSLRKRQSKHYSPATNLYGSDGFESGDVEAAPSMPFTHELPWWQIIIFRNTSTKKRRKNASHNPNDVFNSDSLLLFRVDHSIGDGQALGKVFCQLLSNADGSPMESSFIPSSITERTKKLQKRSKLGFLLKLIPTFISVSLTPMTKYDDDIAFVKDVGENMVYTGNRKCIFFPAIPLSFIKSLKDKAGVSLNDIVMTAFSQAVHDYCQEEHCPILEEKGMKVQCRVLCPAALPNKNEEKSNILKNTWAFVSMNLGVGYETIRQRLEYLHSESNKMKSSPYAFLQCFIINKIFPLLPMAMCRKLNKDIFTRHSMTFSNVPGPQKQLSIVGKDIKSVRFYLNHLVPTVCILSYNGEMTVSLVTDDEGIPNVNKIPSLFTSALISLANEFDVEVPKEMK